MSVGVSLGRFTLRAMPRRSRWSATVRRWTPKFRARSSSERPCWYSEAAAANAEGVSRRWTGFVGRRAAPLAVGDSTPSTSARSALEPGFECCPLRFGSPALGRFEGRLAAFCTLRPAAGASRNPWSGASSRVSGGFESRPQRSTDSLTCIFAVPIGTVREPRSRWTKVGCQLDLFCSRPAAFSRLRAVEAGIRYSSAKGHL
jgi:hypothetical protein